MSRHRRRLACSASAARKHESESDDGARCVIVPLAEQDVDVHMLGEDEVKAVQVCIKIDQEHEDWFKQTI